MKKINKFLLLLMLGAYVVFNPPLTAENIAHCCHQQSEVRAAIDFGSGAVKIQVATVDIEKNRLIGSPLLAKYTPLGLTEDVAANNGYISDDMQKRALDILKGFKEEARDAASQDEVEFIGIATAVFRKAKNGSKLLEEFEKELGIRFRILSQEDEGKLGFLTAQALYPQIAEEYLLAWDSGNGSFQISANESGSVYQGPLGHGTVRVMLSKEIRRGAVLQSHESGNPISEIEARLLEDNISTALPRIPDWLQAKLSSRDTVIATFGDGESIFALVAQAVAVLDGCKEPVFQTVITQENVQRVIDTFLSKEDREFDAAGLHRKTLLSAIHLSTAMKYFGIKSLFYSRSVGSTSGMLIAPHIWVKNYN